jgi:replication factor C small subunit
MKGKLWVERYRPNTIDGYVFVDDRMKEQVTNWIATGTMPHLLLSGEAGVGKTTLAKILINELGVEDYDVMTINASRENGVDTIREKITGFVSTMPFGKFKVVLLDEADYLTPNGQAMLRNEIESYADTARFILTCNFSNKIMEALKSRCHEINITKTDKVEFTARVATVLVTENIDFDLETLDTYVSATYPDLRKCLNQVQINSDTGKLLSPQSMGNSQDELLLEATKCFKSNKVVDGRLQLLQYLALYPTRIEEIYRWCYNNLDLWGKTAEQKDAAVIIIRNGLANLPLVGIPEISLAASLVELTSI